MNIINTNHFFLGYNDIKNLFKYKSINQNLHNIFDTNLRTYLIRALPIGLDKGFITQPPEIKEMKKKVTFLESINQMNQELQIQNNKIQTLQNLIKKLINTNPLDQTETNKIYVNIKDKYNELQVNEKIQVIDKNKDEINKLIFKFKLNCLVYFSSCCLIGVITYYLNKFIKNKTCQLQDLENIQSN